MRYLRRISLPLALAIMLPLSSHAQMPRGRFEEIGLPRFDINAVSLLSDEPGLTRVIAYIEIPYENLQFLRSSRGYEANYEVDLSVLAGPNESSPRVRNEIWRSTVIVSTFKQTNSRERFDISETSVQLKPGRYTMVATVTDLETRKKKKATRTLQVPSYHLGGLAMGDLLLAREIERTNTGAFEIVPNVDRIVAGSDEALFVYYEIYPNGADTLDVRARVLNSRGDAIHEIRNALAAESPVTRDYLSVPANKLKSGRHVVEIQVRGRNQSTLKSARFEVRMSGLPASVQNMEVAIRQLRYIAGHRTTDRMLNANPADRRQLFRDFWKDKDPSPNTPENELMQEYYNRVSEVNRRFGGMREGWETDRGEVYIRFGPPDDIERHPFEVDSRPYEIWYYHDRQRRFVFVDELGYGEYRLVSNLWQ